MWSAVEDAAAAFEPAGMHAAHEVNGHASRTPSPITKQLLALLPS